MSSIFQSPIEFLKGVGPTRAELLKRELGIFTFSDLLQYFPYRYEDRTQIVPVASLAEGAGNVLVKGTLKSMEKVGEPGRQRLVALLYDGWNILELVFFQRIQWIEKNLSPGQQYLAFGKPQFFMGKRPSMVHPEVDLYTEDNMKQGLLPIYHTSEAMKTRRCDSKAIQAMMRTLLDQHAAEVEENLPEWVIMEKNLIAKQAAVRNIHFPETQNLLGYSQRRLKFEELLNLQVRLLRARHTQKKATSEVVVGPTELTTKFLHEVFPYPLTDAQRKVLREITADLKTGKQMNRLLQGDVGSGKTVVAFVAMLMVVEAGFQAAMLAPTEILTEQHYANIVRWADTLGITCAKLTGSTPKKERDVLFADLESGACQMLIGTHAIIEQGVQFKALGISIIDEQHRFGVDQRAALKAKGGTTPHMMVMTATPIPRTLALSLYGDLDVSVIDQLPSGRKPIRTVHRYEKDREKVHEFIRSEVMQGRQAYIVFPLIEESEKVNLNNLLEGYEEIKANFPEYSVSMVHGRMKWAERDQEMKAFIEKRTHIMVATTVIEVGVDVPNASVMLIENSERFGLSQLHQLRGRVGRGADQSYCILMTSYNLTQEGRERIKTMVESTDGFYISEVDLRLRGTGDIMGTQQSGYLKFLIADLINDTSLMVEARDCAQDMLEDHSKTLSSRHYLNTMPLAQGTGHDYLQIA